MGTGMKFIGAARKKIRCGISMGWGFIQLALSDNQGRATSVAGKKDAQLHTGSDDMQAET